MPQGDEAGEQYLNGPPDYIIKKKNRTAGYGQPFHQKKRGYTSGSDNNAGFRPNRTHANSQQIVKKETVYMGEHDLGNGSYNVEILFTVQE